MKKCPYCAEEIQEVAIKCKHCGEMLRQYYSFEKVVAWIKGKWSSISKIVGEVTKDHAIGFPNVLVVSFVLAVWATFESSEKFRFGWFLLSVLGFTVMLYVFWLIFMSILVFAKAINKTIFK